MATATETLRVSGIRCERCVGRLAAALRGHEGLEYANANLVGDVTLTWDEEETSRDAILAVLARSGFPEAPARAGIACSRASLQPPGTDKGTVGRVSEPEPDTEARRIAKEARDRARFEEDALSFADQVYRVARRLVGSREEAEDLVQETYARAFRSWRSFTPGTNMRAWLLRILTNLNVDRGRKVQRTPQTQPLEETDYYLANKLASAGGEEVLETDEVVERLSQDSIVNALAEIQPQFRDVVVLVDIGDFTYADAAQILDIPIGTVMSRLHRGRRALKQRLAEEALT